MLIGLIHQVGGYSQYKQPAALLAASFSFGASVWLTLGALVLCSGEATASVVEWWKTGRALWTAQAANEVSVWPSRGRVNPFLAPPLSPTFTRPMIFAADPVRTDLPKNMSHIQQ